MYDEIVVNHHYAGFNPVLFGYEQCESGHCYGPAVREYWLLHYVMSGEGVFEREGCRHSLHAGDIFVIPPHVETVYQADAKCPWQYIWIGYTGEEIDVLSSRPVHHLPQAGAIFEKMKNCHLLEGGRSAFLVARLWELVSVLQEQQQESVNPVEKALHCMQAEYMNSLTVSNLATRLHLERTYFSTLFKRKVGISPQKYLLNLRMNTAARLMTEKGERPIAAALSVGYSDICLFSRMFKRHFGLSPRAYVAQVTSKSKY